MSNLTKTVDRLDAQVSTLLDSVKKLWQHHIDTVDRDGGLYVKAFESGSVKFATGDQKALNALSERVRKLEGRAASTAEELGEFVVDYRAERHARARAHEAGEQEALGTLAKAQSATRRRATPEGLLERGMKVMQDPTAVGVLTSFLNDGLVAKAAQMVADAEAKAAEQGEDEALARVERQVAEHDTVAAVSELAERFGALERTLNSVVTRLGRLEGRQVAPAPQTVAKAAGARRAKSDDVRDTVEGLMTRLEAVFDRPDQVGMLSSMLQAGQVEEVRQAVERAELAHETDQIKRARRSL